MPDLIINKRWKLIPYYGRKDERGVGLVEEQSSRGRGRWSGTLYKHYEFRCQLGKLPKMTMGAGWNWEGNMRHIDWRDVEGPVRKAIREHCRIWELGERLPLLTKQQSLLGHRRRR